MASKAVAREGDTIVHPSGSVGSIVRERDQNNKPVNPEDIFIDKRIIAVDGDTCSTDGTKIIVSTETVFAHGEKKKVLRLGDKCGNDGVITVAADTVFAGD